MKVCSVCHRCFDDAVFSCIAHSDTELSSIRNGDTGIVTGYDLKCLIHGDVIAETYLAHHRKSDRQCVIKIFAGSSDGGEQFLREAEAAESLFDPNVADVYETGSLDNGDLYLVTEQLSGRSLREILDEGGVDLLKAVNIIRQAAEAVHSLHLKGLVHRAICPENIIVSDGSGVRLTNADFGGLVEHSIVSDKFTIDSAVDVLRYFAPEQFSGKQSTIKTDVYGLGIVFYEMLTGRPPFCADTAAGLIEMHRTLRPADVTIDDFDLRMLITHTLMESLNKHPENRQSSANAFARQLRHVEQLATHVSTPPPAVSVSVPIRAAELIVKVRPAVEHNNHVEKEIVSIVEPAPPRYVPAPTPPIVYEASVECTALPAASRLDQFRRRLKRHRHEHPMDSLVQNEVTAEKAVSEPVDTPPAIVSIEMPPQEIEIEAPVQAAPTKQERADTVEATIHPTIPQPIFVPAIGRTKDIVITNPRKLGLRNVISTSPSKTEHHEPDEITAVTARSRSIKVSIEAPKRQRSHEVARGVLSIASDDNWFFPTLFGASSASAADERSSMFSGFYGERTGRGALLPRVIKTGCLVIAIASLVLVGKQFTGELRSEAAPVAVISQHTVSPPAPQPIAEVQYESTRISETTSTNLQAMAEKTSNGPASAKTSADARLPTSRSAFSDDKTSSDTNATRSRPSPESRTSKVAKADAAKTGSREQPSTRTAKTDSRPQSVTRTVNKPVAQNKPGATTRPRVVANPRP